MSIKTAKRESEKKNKGTTRTKKVKINEIIAKWKTTKKKVTTTRNRKRRIRKQNYIRDNLPITVYYKSVKSGETSEGKMTNLRDAETRVTTGDSGNITRTKHGYWNGY